MIYNILVYTTIRTNEAISLVLVRALLEYRSRIVDVTQQQNIIFLEDA